MRLYNAGGDSVGLNVDATSTRVFAKDSEDTNYIYYTAPVDSSFKLVLNKTYGTFKLTNTVTGDVYVFNDFVGNQPGLLLERTTLQWDAAGREGTLYTYDAEDRISEITTAEGQEYHIVFAYSGSGSSSKLTMVEVRAGTSSVYRIRRVDYTYFISGTHSTDLGSDGDLVQVRVSTLKTAGVPMTPVPSQWTIRYTQYRYDSQGLLKAVFDPDAVQRIIDDRSDITYAGDILTKGDDNDNSGQSPKIKEYASRWLTYYTSNLDTSGTINTV